MASKDPLDLAGLDPANLAKVLDGKNSKGKVPTELEVKKEARLELKEQRISKGLSAGKSGGNQSETPPPAVHFDVVDKSSLLDRLGAYRERFPNLKKRNNVTAKSGVEDILDELHYTARWWRSSRSIATCGTPWVLGSRGSGRSRRIT